jgi:hypothetical protein
MLIIQNAQEALKPLVISHYHHQKQGLNISLSLEKTNLNHNCQTSRIQVNIAHIQEVRM